MWYKYGGALLLKDREPHYDNLDITPDCVKTALKENKCYFCRWTSDFDCGSKTEWWYCIKDTPVVLGELSSKQRYRINKGLKGFDVRLLTPQEIGVYLHRMFEIAVDCFKEYPLKYRPIIEEDAFQSTHLEGIKTCDYWIVIDKDNDKPVGYSICSVSNRVVHLSVVKIKPEALKREPNAAVIYTLCEYYLNKHGLMYICDGERNIRHETNYQDYLVKTINFRYAYCKLNIVYRPAIRLIVSVLYPFRGLIGYFGKHMPSIYNLFCLLKQEEYARSFKE